ncbi:protein kinase [Plasmodium gonderi]|uniref:Protein kinase n=1 Tax=Plasmodium gonderi TaxID=77519 RepID=A0A1Y1JIX5_PLAGO|nr:protein kinase [Plasmodium gonderi]GAW82180.1 protein kinase [Plasmodium gonderi]
MKLFSYIIYSSVLYNITTVIEVFHYSFVNLFDDGLTFLSTFKRNTIPSESAKWDDPPDSISIADKTQWGQFRHAHLLHLFVLKNCLPSPRCNSYTFYVNPVEKEEKEIAENFQIFSTFFQNIPGIFKKLCQFFSTAYFFSPHFFCSDVYILLKKTWRYIYLLHEKSVSVTSTSESCFTPGIIRDKEKFAFSFARACDSQFEVQKQKQHGEERETKLTWQDNRGTPGGGREENIFQHPKEIQTLGQNLLNDKYYLTKKIKDVFRRTGFSKQSELDVIYIPRVVVKQENRSNEKCTQCVVNTVHSLYALKLRHDVVAERYTKSIHGIEPSDVQIYYDYEKMVQRGEKITENLRDINMSNRIGRSKERDEEEEEEEDVKEEFFSFMRWLRGPYKMIDFVKRLYITYLGKEEEIFTEVEPDAGKSVRRHEPKKLNYTMKGKMGSGSFGEIWYAIDMKKEASFKNVVLKKILIHKNEKTSEANAMREIYFGELLKNCENISRFIEFFTEYEMSEENGEQKYVWLVFANEGYSLSDHIFHVDENNASGMLTPSNLWWSIKKQNIGMLVLKDIIQQILNGIHIAHQKNITHRDLKMENIFLSASTPFTVRVGDWGSAVKFGNDEFLFTPSENEETEGYQPPESLFGHMRRNFMRLPYYDMWSIGIIFLQLVLGTKNPLEVKNKRNIIKLQKFYAKYSTPDALKEAIFLQSLSELCLLPWNKSSDELILLKKKKYPYSSIYKNNKILNIISLSLTTNLINLKKHRCSSFMLEEFSTARHSLISVIPNASPICKDANCLEAYNDSLKNSVKYGYQSGEVVYGHLISANLHLRDKQKRKFTDVGADTAVDVGTDTDKHIFLNNSCDDEKFQKILQDRDPSGVGLPNANARNLLRRLLTFDYATRISAEEALRHPWFFEP